VTQDPEVETVLKRIAEKVGAPFDVTGKSIEFSYRFESSRMLGPHNRICLTTPNSKFEHLAVPLIGEHQAINCGLALSILDRLKARGVAINDSKAMEGLAKTHIPGRMEMLSTTPRVIADGAHNAASIDAMMRAIGQHVPYDSMVVIFGCCGDKDVPGMLERITSGADKVIFTKVDSVRTADPEDVRQPDLDPLGWRQVHARDTCHVYLLSALALLVLRVLTDDPNHALALHDLAFVADFLHRGPDLHDALSPRAHL